MQREDREEKLIGRKHAINILNKPTNTPTNTPTNMDHGSAFSPGA
jgi:hypothetical protein